MTEPGWFRGAGLGIFVHWDHASQQGLEISWSLAGVSSVPGSSQAQREVTPGQYHSSAATFDPRRWNPRALARLVRQAGAQYVVFTTRHHNGYSMFHTRHSTFSIEHSPYGKDVTAELVDALRAEGLRIGLYYSLSDWRHPDYPPFLESDKPYPHAGYRRSSPKAWGRYLDYVRGQLTELLTNYGRIDLLWFDGQWERTPEEWHAAELRALITSLQPHVLVNDRLPGQGDFVTPEGALPTIAPAGPWEMCLTMGSSWGYRPDDTEYKSIGRILTYLVEVASRGGNLLLNVSPAGDGRLPEPQIARLREIGVWMQRHGESVRSVMPAPAYVEFDGPLAMRGSRLYLYLIMRPVDGATLRGIPVRRVRAVSLLGHNAQLGYQSNLGQHRAEELGPEALGELFIHVPTLPASPLDVIAVDFDGPIQP